MSRASHSGLTSELESFSPAWIINSISEEAGGCESYISDLYAWFRTQGVQVTLFSGKGRGPVRYSGLVSISVPECSRSFSELLFWKQATLELQKGRFSQVFAFRPFPGASHYFPPSGLYEQVYAAERDAFQSDIRRMCYDWANRLNAKRRVLLELEKRMFRNSERPMVLTHSQRQARVFIQKYGLRNNEVLCLRRGVDSALFCAADRQRAENQDFTLSKNGRKLNLLFVAHNFLLKGLHCLLETLASWPPSLHEFQLDVVGGGPGGWFARYAKRLGVANRVRFHGKVSRQRLVQFYQESDVLVHPTFHDHASQVALEALACGCPVITTSLNGLAEILENGKHGFVIDHPRNQAALLEALGVISDPKIRAGMAEEGRQLARNLDLGEHAKEVLNWLGSRSTGE